jgi:hypothetical protein
MLQKPEGKKDKDKSIHSSNSPLANSREHGHTLFKLWLYSRLQDFLYLFYATLGLPQLVG